MKQTAIDFLESEFNKWAEGGLFIPQHIIEQAKAMEKKQIIDAYDKNKMGRVDYGEQYYNETFKSE